MIRWAGPLLLALITVGGILLIGCYKGNPPCDPSTVDWPRCDPTQPPMSKRDGGAERP